jgi:hypothetical protein
MNANNNVTSGSPHANATNATYNPPANTLLEQGIIMQKFLFLLAVFSIIRQIQHCKMNR